MRNDFPAHRHIRGFSLLELMISIVIGMFSVLVIMQVLSSTATSRRVAVGGGDAQLNGVAGMRALQLDVEHAGLGLQSFNVSGCTLTYAIGGTSVTLPAMAPVVINPATSVIPAGDANTDTLLVSSGNSGSPSEGDATTVVTSTGSYVVTTPASFFVGDKVVVAPAARSSVCALQTAQVTGINGFTLAVSGGAASQPSGSIVFNLGSAPSVRAYAIRNGDLVVCDYLLNNCGSASLTSDSTVWVPVASNIVSMRAQYARDTSGISGATSAMDGVADTFDQVTPGSSTDTTAIPMQCRWARVIGVRLAMVARSQQFVRQSATTPLPTLVAPVWSGSTVATNNPTALPINLSGLPNWQNYRYNTIQTMLPMRNAIWQGAQPTYQGGAGAC